MPRRSWIAWCASAASASVGYRLFTLGYSVREVDALTDRVAQYFQSGKAAQHRRGAAPRPSTAQRGGYQEAQVDLLLDAVTRVMLAVR